MNQFHRRAIAVTFRDIDSRLGQIEAILQSIGGESPFSAYALDVGPLARQSVSSYMQRIREKMWAATQCLHISADGRRISAAWAIHTLLIGVLIALCEIEPQRMGGYGRLDPDARTALAGICADLQRLVNGLDAYLLRAQGEDLAQRLARLETSPINREAFSLVEAIITRHGLVELRPMLEVVLARLESPDLEVAFFGRVSSGKSSLLNYLLGTDVLPVGVLPVTAVLTRLRRANQAELVVHFEVSQPQQLPTDRIAEFVTEEGNPNNTRRVTEVEVRLPSRRLARGVVFMDTPGVGSLATFGAAQTKAYLPRCDLGVLLIDAGSSLNHEDLALLRGFVEAAIPALLLVSKSDLLNLEDRRKVIGYIGRQVRETLGADVPVFVVSTRGADAVLADRWFEEQIVPLTRDHREHAERSLRRKIANLCEMAASYLGAMIERAQTTPTTERQVDGAQAEELLRTAAGRIAALATRITESVEAGISEKIERLAYQAAGQIIAQGRRDEHAPRVVMVHVVATMAEAAEKTRADAVELGESLGETVRRLSQLWGVPCVENLTDVLAGLAPLPRADEARLGAIADVRCPRMFTWWTGLALWLARRRICSDCNGAIWSALRDHRFRLRDWLKASLDRLTDAYEADVALFRDQLRHTRDGRAGGVAIEDVKADLDQLRHLVPRTGDAAGLTVQAIGGKSARMPATELGR
jgi:GTP-binding protein EngB required for normal cell division